MQRIILLVCLLATTTCNLFSQSQEIGVFLGASAYQGDLAPKEITDYIDVIHPGGGAFVRVSTGRLGFRFQANYLHVSGDDQYQDERRGLNFETDIWELGLLGELNLFGRSSAQGGAFYPYLFGGVALYHFNPMGTQRFSDQSVRRELQPLGTEGQGNFGYEDPYSLTQFAIPLGIGVKWAVGESWVVGLEFGGRRLFTDYLDDVSGVEIAYSELESLNGQEAAVFSRPRFNEGKDNPDQLYTRGGSSNDWYYAGGLTISYLFGGTHAHRGRYGRSAQCPKF